MVEKRSIIIINRSFQVSGKPLIKGFPCSCVRVEHSRDEIIVSEEEESDTEKDSDIAV